MLTIQDVERIESKFKVRPGEARTTGDGIPDDRELLCADWREWQAKAAQLTAERDAARDELRLVWKLSKQICDERTWKALDDAVEAALQAAGKDDHA